MAGKHISEGGLPGTVRREGELENLEKLAAEEGGAIVADLPRSPDVQRAEAMGGTVVDALPESEMAACYCALAARVLEVCGHG